MTFNRKLDRVLSKAADALVDVRRIEVITDTGWRRRWSGDDKARILFEILQPGVNVSEVARRHCWNQQQLFAWRNAARAGAAESAEAHERLVDSGLPVFTPVIVSERAALPAPQPAPSAAITTGTIEIALGDAIACVSG